MRYSSLYSRSVCIEYVTQKGNVISGKNISFCNLMGLKMYSRYYNAKKSLKKWCEDNNQEEAKKEENLNTEGNNNQEQTNSSNEEESNQNQQENKTEEVTEISKTGYVKADGLNIRKEPTTSSEAIHSLSFNSKVKITGEIDGWYRIDYNDQIGYVSQIYVSDTKLPETTARGGYDRTTAFSEENTVANQEAVEENQVETEEEQEEESTASATSSEGNDVVEFAKKYLGYKYVAGGSSPSTGFDCSGFTTYVFRNFGVSLNRSSKDQIKNGTAVSKSNLQPGDIVIFKNQGKTAIGHVGIYIGSGNFIHAANKKEGVVITALSSSYYSQRYVGARRVI